MKQSPAYIFVGDYVLLKKWSALLCALILLSPFTALAADLASVSAECACVLDVTTGKILYEKNAYQKHAMASTTKLMTCLLACESGRLGESITVTDEMLKNTEGTSLYLKAGDTVTLADLVKGAMLESGNDAAGVIACFLAGSTEAFAAKMNEKAALLNMKQTHFVTPSGLDEKEHYSTAYDMARLGAACCQNKVLANIAKAKSDTITISGKKRTLYNHNKLLQKSSHFIGLKTGFTNKAGRCLVSAYSYRGSTLICVTLNAPDDWRDHSRLVKYAKTQYVTAAENKTVILPAVGTEKRNIRCRYAYQVKTCGDVSVKLSYYPFLYAPVKRGETVGKADIYCNHQRIKTVALVTDEES